MVVDPLAINPTETTPVQDPGFFDGQLPVEAQTAVEPLAQPIEQPMQEETQVAGFGSILEKVVPALAPVVTKGRMDAPRFDSVIDEGATQGAVGPYTIIREASPEEVNEFYELRYKDMGQRVRGAPSPTAAQRAEGVPATEFNLENIQGPDDLKKTIDSVSQIWQQQGHRLGRGKLSHEEIMEMADQQGLGNVVDRLLKGAEGFNLATLSEDITASLQAITSSAMELNRLAKIARTSTDQQDLLRFRQHMAFHGALQSNMKGAQMEVARALGAFRIPRSSSKDAAIAMQEGIQNIMEEFGGDRSVREMADAYLALESQAARNNFSGTAWDKAKGAWFEVWINGLLSSLNTHVANMTSNTVFQLLQFPERAIAGGIGTVRRALGTKSESVYLQESVAEAVGFIQGIGDGFKLAAEAWRTEAPVRDLAGKVQAARQRAISSESLGIENQFFAKGVDYIGAGIRAPGRALMTEDEFFKAVAFRRELNALATRTGLEMRRNGESAADIKSAIDDILSGRNAEATNTAQEFAQYSTFTDPVGGKLGEMGAWVQSFTLGRMLNPFFRTPVKITSAMLERSPYGLVKALLTTNDPIKRDMLYARASMGTAAMIWAANKFGEGRITGSGPSDPNLRRQMEDIGWQKWSFVTPKDGIETPRLMQIGHMYILHPDDVVYHSYHRMEPISMTLAISADIAARFRWPTAEQETWDEHVLAGLNAMFGYLKEQTWLQSMGNVVKLFEIGDAQGNARFAGFAQNMVGSQVPYSSMLSAIERIPEWGGNPTNRLVIPDRNEPPGLNELYAGLKRLDDRLPWTDQKGPVLKDRFGVPRMAKNASVREFLLPPYIADVLGEDHSAVQSDPVKLAILNAGVPLSMPPRRIEGVTLTAEEYDAFLGFAVAPPPGEDGLPVPSFYDAMKETVEMKSFKNLENVADKQTLIREVDRKYKQLARSHLLDDPRFEDRFADLRARVREIEEDQRTLGRQVQ